MLNIKHFSTKTCTKLVKSAKEIKNEVDIVYEIDPRDPICIDILLVFIQNQAKCVADIMLNFKHLLF